jgi:hypothetical protein
VALGPPRAAPAPALRRSGKHWVAWADEHARGSQRVDDLAEPFRSGVREFLGALHAAGARVTVHATRRSARRAYLFHWCWLLALERVEARDVPPHAGVPIAWDHGNRARSAIAARAMVRGFALAVPPRSVHAPSLRSHHILGNAIDMTIRWRGAIHVAARGGRRIALGHHADVNQNAVLHALGASYGVHKLVTDAPHWSVDGR